MSFELSIDEKEGFLHFRVNGDNDAETVKNYLAEIHKECIQRNASCILIEEDLRGPGLGVVEIFMIVEQGSPQAASILRRIAYVDKSPDHSYANLEFAETVASNRGLNMKVFTTVEDAAKWLQSAQASE